MPRPATRRLSADAFDRLRPYLHSLSDDRVEAARCAIVEGEMQKDIAVRFNWQTRQAVTRAIEMVWAKLEEAIEKGFDPTLNDHVPDGWVTKSLSAPPELMKKFEKDIAASLKEAKKAAAALEKERRQQESKKPAQKKARTSPG